MATPFLGEIRAFSFITVPRGWMPCDGKVLSIQNNQALFSLVGTQFGGDGRTTFGIPNLLGRVAVHPDAQNVAYGQLGGEETHTLQENELPSHTHQVTAGSDASGGTSPAGHSWGTSFVTTYGSQLDGRMKADAISTTGGNQAHQNMQPYNVFQYCIAIEGIYPQRP